MTLADIIRNWVKDSKFNDKLWVWSDLNRDYLLIHIDGRSINASYPNDGVSSHWAADIFEDRVICRDTKWNMYELSIYDKEFFNEFEKILLHRLDWYGPNKYYI